MSPPQAESGASEDEFQSLIQFLYRTPVGLVEFRADGTIALMNPKAAQLLMPLSRDGTLLNLYDLLENDIPALRQVSAKLMHSGSVEALRFNPQDRDPRAPKRVLSLSIFGSADETLTAVLHDATREERRQQRRVEAARTVDSTTGLPNRVAILEHLTLLQGKLQGAAAPAVLVYLGVDRFQQINDTAGHVAGDAVLAQIAERLVVATEASAPDFAATVPGDPDSIAVPANDAYVARVGGDEFAVVAQMEQADAQALAQTVLRALHASFVVADKLFQCACSVGVLMLNEHDAPEECLYRARLAMTSAKEAGGHRAVVFEPGLEQRAQHRSAMEVALRGAVQRGELFVVYQPVVGLKDGSLQAAEALVRWRHPRLGLVSPADFIGIAEEAGLIDGIGRFVLHTACEQFVAWQARYADRAPQLMAVNLSRAQLPRADLAAEVAEILRVTGMHPSRLQLEVTESMAAQDAQVQQRLHELKQLGVSLALDDFGTGFSSLSSLHELPVDLLKIDRSFVSQLENSAHHRVLVEATLRVAKSLNLRTVAEGVETEGQALLLGEMLCEKAQGYLISRPLTPEQFDVWIRHR